MKDLGTLGGIASQANAINNMGQVTGYSDVWVNSNLRQHAFLRANGTMTDIGKLLSGLPYSFGYGINNLGHVAGTAYNSSYSIASAFLYDGASAAEIGGLGGSDASALAINDTDQITGYASTADGFEHAFLYASGAMRDLGTLGGHYSYGLGINNNGVVVGGSFIDRADSIYHAFIWSNNVMQDLNGFLDATGAGWVLVEARALNDLGQIAGLGTYGGANHMFLLSPAQVAPPPQITSQPTNQTVNCQGSATFVVTATPNGVSYQWYKGLPPSGLAIGEATADSLNFPNVSLAQAGSYYCVVSNTSGTATSSAAVLTVLDVTPPVISGCPADLTNYTGADLSTAIVTWAAPTASDDCDGPVPVTCAPVSGSVFPKGVTTVTCQAKDASGNTGTCTFAVTVLVPEAPLITATELRGTEMVLRFTTLPNALYSVEASGDLAAESWSSTVTDIPGTGTIVEVSVPASAGVSCQFFRIRQTF